MPSPPVALRIEQAGPVTVIAIVTPRIPIEARDFFEEQVLAAVARVSQPRVALDFSAVEFISSAILGKLIKLNGAITTDRGGQLVLCGLIPRIADVFKTTGLDRLFTIHKNREEAVRSFEPAP